MGAIRTPREKWLEAGLRALVAGGPEAVRIEALAQSLGVTKGGFYGYFRNRDALLAEMLDLWEREVAESVIEEVERGGGDARERLDRLFGLVAAASEGPVRGVTADIAIRDWARRDPAVAERLRRVDNRRADYLRSLFSSFCPDEDEVEVRCLIAMSVRVGNHFNAADHGGRGRAEVMELLRRRLLA
ncbi:MULTISPECIES: TetR/AcrR family transcriptional regulator [Streptomyces]|uniref:TetR family transcriptional regulator n=2 Tax=Streptomyces TaxID=1883 RepID=A0A2U9NXM6_STRAS|nr:MULTISPECIES: TetR/AcrR family transcriptional regulator [Streptomyces]AWT42070.1 TetR family transcriptional regulator [Streptomyces actuosus]MBM4825309.1 TetR/AcrR family transcriptional regulator [Streptomyces actuosus]GHF82832.1 TetR family transcriptional regulator [Streptomyces griseosporeus]